MVNNTHIHIKNISTWLGKENIFETKLSVNPLFKEPFKFQIKWDGQFII